MKIAYASDLHLEFNSISLLESMGKPVADVIVLAGDVAPTSMPEFWEALTLLESWNMPVIYVAGNHEYYGSKYNLDFKRLSSRKNITLAGDYEEVVLEGRTFRCGTGWYPFMADTDSLYGGRWTDFNWIKGSDAKFFGDKNKSFSKALVANCNDGDIIVTHHLPKPINVALNYWGQETNRFYIAHLPTLKAKNLTYIYGHTHEPNNQTINGNRYLCNPAGYPEQLPPFFTWEYLEI